MKQFDHVLVRVNQRATYKGRPLKPSANAISGEEVLMEVMWMMDDDDPYPGEWALSPVDDAIRHRFYDHHVGWVASGDVEFLAPAFDPFDPPA